MLKAKIFESQIILKSLGARKPKGPKQNSQTRLMSRHLCLMEENI